MHIICTTTTIHSTKKSAGKSPQARQRSNHFERILNYWAVYWFQLAAGSYVSISEIVSENFTPNANSFWIINFTKKPNNNDDIIYFHWNYLVRARFHACMLRNSTKMHIRMSNSALNIYYRAFAPKWLVAGRIELNASSSSTSHTPTHTHTTRMFTQHPDGTNKFRSQICLNKVRKLVSYQTPRLCPISAARVVGKAILMLHMAWIWAKSTSITSAMHGVRSNYFVGAENVREHSEKRVPLNGVYDIWFVDN